MEVIEQQTRTISDSYVTDYEIDDPAFAEPFAVKRAVGYGAIPWWSKRPKVEALISAFKNDYTIHEACQMAGISQTQYKYFCRIHPEFIDLKHRCELLLGIVAKRGLVADILDPKNSRARQWYLERTQQEIYGRNRSRFSFPPPYEDKLLEE